MGGSSRVSCRVLGAGLRKAGRAGWGAEEGKWLQLIYLLFLLREENRGRQPGITGERALLGAGLCQKAPQWLWGMDALGGLPRAMGAKVSK